MDQDEQVEFYEFNLLYRHTEPERYIPAEVAKLFFEECDIIIPESGEKALSLDKFVSVAIEKKLFDREKISIFSKKHNVN